MSYLSKYMCQSTLCITVILVQIYMSVYSIHHCLTCPNIRVSLLYTSLSYLSKYTCPSTLYITVLLVQIYVSVYSIHHCLTCPNIRVSLLYTSLSYLSKYTCPSTLYITALLVQTQQTSPWVWLVRVTVWGGEEGGRREKLKQLQVNNKSLPSQNNHFETTTKEREGKEELYCVSIYVAKEVK